MKIRPNIAWMLWLLVVSMLLRGVPHALAQPMVVDVPQTVVTATAACHEHAAATTRPASLHDQGACKITCELGAAPAFTAIPLLQAKAIQPVWVPNVPSLVLADAVPPDDPPPI